VRRSSTDLEGVLIVSIVRRLCTVAAVAAAVVTAMPAAAQAVLPASSFTFQVHDIHVAPGGDTQDAFVGLIGGKDTPATLTHVQMVIDASEIARFATVVPAPGCTTKKAIITCSIVSVDGRGGHYVLPSIAVKSRTSSQPGDTGTLRVRVLSKEAAPLHGNAPVTVIRDVDLGGVSRSPGSIDAEPVGFGQLVKQPIGISNAGHFTARGVGVIFSYDPRFEPVAKYSNCGYYTAAHYTQIFCKFTDRIPAGATYQLDQPMFRVRADAKPDVAFSFGWDFDPLDTVNAEGDAWYRGHTPTPGTGPELHLVPASGAATNEKDDAAKGQDFDLNGVNNMAQGWVKTPKKASPTATQVAAGGETGGGGLPVTGSNAMMLAGAGVLLLVIGVGVFFFTRRRGTTFDA
jgi:LPXTG-motif cell wall-anchored protein